MAYKITGSPFTCRYNTRWQRENQIILVKFSEVEFVDCRKYSGNPKDRVVIDERDVIDYSVESFDWPEAERGPELSEAECEELRSAFDSAPDYSINGAAKWLKARGFRKISGEFVWYDDDEATGRGIPINIETIGRVSEELDRIISLSKHGR